MELTAICEAVLRIFEINSIGDLPSALYDTVINNRYEKYAQFEESAGDLSVDTLQIVFQYYEADRKEKKQDYTPPSLARLTCRLAEMDGEKVVLDLCAGSGALTIQKWNLNKDLNFICYELDKKVIPTLLFNLAVRNITATVINGDALQDETYAIYNVKSGDKYSTVKKVKVCGVTNACSCISNPPYNIKWTQPVFAQLQPRFAECGLPPESNANYAFILTALDKINGKCVMILPNGVLTTDNAREVRIRKYLVDKNLIDAVVRCPDKMFEATGIPACIVVFNKNKTTTDIEFVDMRRTFEVKQREQRGQYGGAAHTNRVYKKNVNIFTDENIEKAVNAIREHLTECEFSKSVSSEEIAENDYSLAPSRYIDFREEETQHRAYSDIARDLNYIAREKSLLKITINESLAKSLGLDIELYKKDEENAIELNKCFEAVGEKYEYRPYIRFSKNKNEFKIENQDKEKLSSVLSMFWPMWKHHLYYLNTVEDTLLIEFRDAMLPDLMNGKTEV